MNFSDKISQLVDRTSKKQATRILGCTPTTALIVLERLAAIDIDTIEPRKRPAPEGSRKLTSGEREHLQACAKVVGWKGLERIVGAPDQALWRTTQGRGLCVELLQKALELDPAKLMPVPVPGDILPRPTAEDLAKALAILDRFGWRGLSEACGGASPGQLKAFRDDTRGIHPKLLERLRAFDLEIPLPLRERSGRKTKRIRPGTRTRDTLAARLQAVYGITVKEALIPPPPPFLPSKPPEEVAALLKLFYGKSEASTKSRDAALLGFARFLGTDVVGAVSALITAKGAAHEHVLRFLTHMKGQGLAPKTQFGRVVALRTLVRLAHETERCGYLLDIKLPSGDPVRDTRGPGWAVAQQMLDVAKERGPRDYALLRLFVDLALRRAEVWNLKLEHVRLDRGEISIHGKGRGGRELLRLPAPTQEAIEGWLKLRGLDAGPLWRNRNGNALAATAIYKIVREIGEACGVKTRPHGLRHTAITHALDVTNGDVRRVRQFSRHRSLNMLLTYDDTRQDLGGELAAQLARGDTKKMKRAR